MSYDITNIPHSVYIDKTVKIERTPNSGTEHLVENHINDPYNAIIAFGVYKGITTINDGKNVIIHIHLDGHPEPIIHYPSLTQITIDIVSM